MDSGITTKAAAFAEKAHFGQFRKYTNEPYIVHPLEVAKLVATVTADPEIISAALLHDVAEDTPTTLDEIKQEFGEHVAKLVDELTDKATPDMGDRETRKRFERDRLA